MQCKTVEFHSDPNEGIVFKLKVYSPTARLAPFVPVVVAVHDLGVSGDVFAPLEPELAMSNPANAAEKMRAMMPRQRHPLSRSPNAPPRFIEEMFLVTYDQRGHGSTEARAAAGALIDTNVLADDCARVLDYVEANLFHNHQIFVLAHGLGAAVALSAISRVGRETTKALQGVVMLRDWLVDAASFGTLSRFVDRPLLCASTDEAAAWYVKENLFGSHAAAATVVASLLTSRGDEMEWITSATLLPAMQLVSESVTVLRNAAATLTIPCMVLLFGNARQPESILTAVNGKIQIVHAEVASSPYYPSVDAPHEVVKAVRRFANQVNRDEEVDGANEARGPIMTMLPRPGP